MSYQVENETLPSGFRVVVELDSYPESPRDWDNLGKVVLVDRCRYTFGDEVASNEELREIGLDDELLKLPIYPVVSTKESTTTLNSAKKRLKRRKKKQKRLKSQPSKNLSKTKKTRKKKRSRKKSKKKKIYKRLWSECKN